MTKRLRKQIHGEIAAMERGAAKPGRVWELVPNGRGGFERRAVNPETFRQNRADAWTQQQAITAREKLRMTQEQFARLLGISVRTLHQWEQGRRKPSGAARVLLRVASLNPEAVLQAA